MIGCHKLTRCVVCGRKASWWSFKTPYMLHFCKYCEVAYDMGRNVVIEERAKDKLLDEIQSLRTQLKEKTGVEE